MEFNFYTFAFISIFIGSFFSFSILYFKISQNEKFTDEFQIELMSEIASLCEKNDYLEKKLDDISISINRSMLDLKENFEPAKPIKSNNWDSVREAFKGPNRIEVNV